MPVTTIIEAHLTPSETRLLKLLPQDGSKIATTKLVKVFYGTNPPANAQVVITGLLRSLVKKTCKRKSGPVVYRSERAGPRPMDVWLDVP